MIIKNAFKSKFFWIMLLGGCIISVVITIALGWSIKKLSAVLTVAGFVVLSLSFFSGWGHDPLSGSEGNAGMTEVLKKEPDKMEGKISYSGIFAAVILMLVGTLIDFL